jgi:hypothetical protein
MWFISSVSKFPGKNKLIQPTRLKNVAQTGTTDVPCVCVHVQSQYTRRTTSFSNCTWKCVPEIPAKKYWKGTWYGKKLKMHHQRRIRLPSRSAEEFETLMTLLHVYIPPLCRNDKQNQNQRENLVQSPYGELTEDSNPCEKKIKSLFMLHQWSQHSSTDSTTPVAAVVKPC